MALVDTAWTGIKLQYEETSNPYFEVIAKEALGLIAAKPVGARLLAEIGKQTPVHTTGLPRGCNVLIKPTTDRKFYSQAVRPNASDKRDMMPSGLSGSCNAAIDVTAAGVLGSGSACNLYFNNTIRLTSKGEKTYPFVVLAHELIHSLHCLSGTRKNGKAEEECTTGIKAYANEEISENAIRAEHGLPLRTDYH